MLYSINLLYHVGAYSDEDAVQIAKEMNELIQSKYDSSLSFEIHRIEKSGATKLEVYNLVETDMERHGEREEGGEIAEWTE